MGKRRTETNEAGQAFHFYDPPEDTVQAVANFYLQASQQEWEAWHKRQSTKSDTSPSADGVTLGDGLLAAAILVVVFILGYTAHAAIRWPF